MAENKDSNNEVEIGPHSVKLSRDAYSDLRPLVSTSVAVVEPLLGVLANASGLSADFLNHRLVAFRERFKKQFEKIPSDRRELPSFRVGASVLKEVTISRDEPEFQRMFADLLASASDSKSAESVHPGYAYIINQITSVEAKILQQVVDDPHVERFPISIFSHLASDLGLTANDVYVGIDNLTRLGLLKLCDATTHTLTHVLGTLHPAPVGGVRATRYGNQFVATCLPRESNQSTQ